MVQRLNARETGVAGNVRRVRACVHKRNTRVPGDAELVRMAVQRNGREADAAAERKGRLRAALTRRGAMEERISGEVIARRFRGMR